MTERWPKQQRLVREVREVLRREFGCQDAWVVRAGERCRLEVRLKGRQILLFEDDETAFWARFYMPVERERVHLGEHFVQIRQWRKPPLDLVMLLTPYWRQHVGQLPGEPARPQVE